MWIFCFLFFFIVYHKSVDFFTPFHSFSFFDWIISRILSSRSLILFLAWLSLLLKLSNELFISIIVVFYSGISVWLFTLVVFVALSNFFICLCIVFLMSFRYLPVFFSSLLNFKRIILHSLTVCRSLFTSVIFGVVSSGGVIFSFSWPLIPYVCVCTVEYLDFSYSLISLLLKRQIFPSQLSLGFWACLLIVSLGKWSLLLWSVFLRDNWVLRLGMRGCATG